MQCGIGALLSHGVQYSSDPDNELQNAAHMLHDQKWVRAAPHLPNAVLLLVLFLQISNVEGKESKTTKETAYKIHYFVNNT